MKRRKGFTLIELLAVIVILAIIAVIATPIIVNIIEESRKAAFERSVEGILHATDLDFGTQEVLSSDPYVISDGQVNKTLKTPIKNIDGFSGTIKYDENGNSEYAIHNGKWCMIKTGDVITTEEYNEETCVIEGAGNEVGITQDVSKNGNPVYYDVVNGVECSVTDYHEDNSLTGYNGIGGTGNQTSCLKFYSFNYNPGDAKVNLILDHNTTPIVEWHSGWLNINGPITLMDKLYEDTSLWTGTLTPSDYSLTQLVSTSEGETDTKTYIIDYDNDDDTKDYKARLITAQEVAQITGAEQKEGLMFNESTALESDTFYFDSLTTSSSNTCKSGNTSGCSYGWLYDRTSTSCTARGCYNNADSGMTGNGYWTASSILGLENVNAWIVAWSGRLAYTHVTTGDYGVRPVIEVKKANLN